MAFSEPSFRSAAWNSQSQEESGRPTSKKSATRARNRSFTQRSRCIYSTSQVREKGQPLAACQGEEVGARSSSVEKGYEIYFDDGMCIYSACHQARALDRKKIKQACNM